MITRFGSLFLHTLHMHLQLSTVLSWKLTMLMGLILDCIISWLFFSNTSFRVSFSLGLSLVSPPPPQPLPFGRCLLFSISLIILGHRGHRLACVPFRGDVVQLVPAIGRNILNPSLYLTPAKCGGACGGATGVSLAGEDCCLQDTLNLACFFEVMSR